MKRIFFVEDDLSLINGLSFAIKKQGFEIDIARTSLEAETLWINGKYDLVILDVSLPDGSGFDICKRIRQTSKIPIMFLTAADEETDIIMGLDIGADDYITKPFKLAVFLSRINALLRRSDNFNQPDAELSSNGITLQRLKGEGYKQGKLLDLTSNEYKLLCLFMENPGVVLSQEQILGSLWDCDGNYIVNKALTVYIRRLRMKIEDDPGEPQALYTLFCILGMGIAVLVFCYRYFQEENKIMEDAVAQIRENISGDWNARIECDDEGELYRLFHEVNSLAAILNAQAENEGKSRKFLQNTISDISHQLKTPLAALNIYNGIIQTGAETDDLPTVREFSSLSEQELERIETLVQNLLKIAKFDAGTIVIEKNQENISEMMEDVKKQFSFRSGQEGKEIVLSGNDSLSFFVTGTGSWKQSAIS